MIDSSPRRPAGRRVASSPATPRGTTPRVIRPEPGAPSLLVERMQPTRSADVSARVATRPCLGSAGQRDNVASRGRRPPSPAAVDARGRREQRADRCVRRVDSSSRRPRTRPLPRASGWTATPAMPHIGTGAADPPLLVGPRERPSRPAGRCRRRRRRAGPAGAARAASPRVEPNARPPSCQPCSRRPPP